MGSELQYLNPASFAQNALGTFGTLGRDAARTPGLLSFDASLDRVFGLTERLRLDVRADAFNVINHTNLGAATQTRRSDSRYFQRRHHGLELVHIWPHYRRGRS